MSNDLNIRLVLDGNQFRAELRNSTGEVERFSTRAEQGAGVAAQAFNTATKAAVGLLATIGAGQLVRGISSMADSYADLSSKIRNVTSGEAELLTVRRQVFAVAQLTRQQYESTGELYAALTRATGDLALSEANRLRIVETINKSMVVSGASAQAATNAIVQLNQGLASGALRGEEFNSIAEQAPVIMDLLANSLGKSRGELREMAAQGQITAAVLTGALLAGSAEVDRQFGNMALTVSGATQQLKNAALEYVGSVDQTLGASRTVAEGISAVAENFGDLVDGAVAAGTALAAAFAGRVVESMRQYAASHIDTARAQAVTIGLNREFAATQVLGAEATLAQARARAAEMVEQLRSVELIGQELAARQRLAVAEAQAAERTVAATKNMATLSGAVRYQREAVEQLAVAQARLNAVSNEYAAIGVLQGNLQKDIARSADDMIVAQGGVDAAQKRLNGTLTASQVAMQRLSAAAGSAFALIGGWATVAIAAAYALYQLGEALIYGGTQARENTDALSRLSDEMERAAVKQQLLARGAPEALAEQASVLQQTQQHIAALRVENDELADSWIFASVAGAAYAAIVRRINESGIAEQTDALNRYIETLAVQVATSKDSATALREATAMLAAAGLPTDVLTRRVGELGQRFGQLETISRAAGTAVAAVFGALSRADTGADVEAMLGQIATTDAFSDETNKLIESLKQKAAALGLSGTALLKHEKAQAIARAENQRAASAIAAEYDALIAKTRAVDGAKRAVEQIAPLQREHARTLLAQAAALGEMPKHLADYGIALLEAEEHLRTQIEAGLDAAAAQREYANAVRIAQKAAQDAAVDGSMRLVAALEEEGAVLRDLSAGYAQQARLAGMSEQQRQVEMASLAAIADYRAEHQGQIDAETEAMIRQMVAAGEAQISLAETARQTAEDSSRAWSDFAQGLGRAVLDGAGGVKRYFKQLLDDLKAQIISSGLMNLFRSIFNFGGSSSGSPLSMLGAMFGGGGAGGGGISFGSIMSAFGGQSGGTGGGILSNLFSVQSWARAGQQLAGGFTSMMGGAGNVSALQSYGVLNTPTGMAGGFAGHGGLAGWGGAAAGALYGYGRGDGGIGTVGSTVAGGVAGYYAGGVMAGAAAGGMAGAGAAMAAIPVAGWVAAAALAIDALTGGRLFGTRYRPESSTSTLSVGDDGGDASMSVREVRQRSLFRGRRWRTRDVEAGDGAEEAADQLYDAIYSVMADSARSLAIDTPPMIDAAIRTVTEYDKKGKAKGTKIFVDILGRTWEEATAELAASRLSSEAIIATIDAALGTTVEAALAGIDEGIDRASPEFRERIGELIGDLIPKDEPASAGTVGEASAIAERWRSDATLLAEGAQFLLMAATDIRRGVGLLGDGGGLTAITDLIEDLQSPGESLAQTYARVAASTALLDQALALSGVSIEGTREQIVRLATDIAEAAGGLDRAASLWGNYFDRFYTDAERARMGVTQARANATTQFADIDLDYTQFIGEGGAQAFRELFESVFPTLSAAAIAEWLEAAEALGIVIDATDAYVASMTAQARAQASIIGEINAGIADLSMTDYERQVAGIEGQTRSYVEALIEAGMTMEQATTHALRWRDAQMGALEAQRVAARTSITDEMADSVADVGRTDWERQMVGLDRQAQSYITALVETGVALDEATAAANAWRDSMRAALEDQRRSNFIDQLDDIEWEQSLAGMSAYDRQVATINRRYDELYATAVELGLGEDELLRIRRLQRGELDALSDSTENAARAIARLGIAVVDAGGAVLGTEDARRNWTDIIAEATGIARGDSMSAEQRAIAQLNEKFSGFASSVTESYQSGRLGAIIAGNVEQFDRDYLQRIGQLEALRVEALANLRNDLDRQRFEREEAWVKRLLGIRDSLLLDEQLSTLTPTERLSEAERQYAAAVSAIEAAALTEGTDDDEAARGAFDSVARQMLQEGRAVWGSAQGYTDLLQRVLGDIDRWVQDSPITIGQQIAAQAMQVVIPEGSIQLDTQPVEVLLTGLRNDQDEQTRALIDELREVRRELADIKSSNRLIADNTRAELMPVRAS